MNQLHHVPTVSRSPVAVLPPLREPSVADEANHRIGNNLQLLTALISFEARRFTDPDMLESLAMTRRRIAAIANIHRQLYRAQEPGFVDLGAYLSELGDDLDAAGAVNDGGRRVRVEPASIDVSADDAAAVGIIVAELVGNACKYAYDAGSPGLVRIALRALPRGGYWLEVSDRGHGMALDQEPQGTGFGAQLVAMMAHRLHAAHMWHDNEPGTRFTLCVEPR